MPNRAGIARLLADPSRASMMLALLDGRAWTVAELAEAAGIERPIATGQLAQLVTAGLLDQVRQGPHRYLRIAEPAVAEAVAGLAAPGTGALARRGRSQRPDPAVRAARTCYRHLAGRLGVAITEGMLAAGYLSPDWQLTGSGRRWLAGLGVELDPRATGSLSKPCLDWTERREHLAGRAAEAFLAAMLERSWIRRGPVARSVLLTGAGQVGLASLLGARTVLAWSG